jgi:hypothetical protein
MIVSFNGVIERHLAFRLHHRVRICCHRDEILQKTSLPPNACAIRWPRALGPTRSSHPAGSGWPSRRGPVYAAGLRSATAPVATHCPTCVCIGRYRYDPPSVDSKMVPVAPVPHC